SPREPKYSMPNVNRLLTSTAARALGSNSKSCSGPSRSRSNVGSAISCRAPNRRSKIVVSSNVRALSLKVGFAASYSRASPTLTGSRHASGARMRERRRQPANWVPKSGTCAPRIYPATSQWSVSPRVISPANRTSPSVGATDPLDVVVPLWMRSEEHTSELQSRSDLVCRLLLEKKKQKIKQSLSRNITGVDVRFVSYHPQRVVV